MVEACDTYRIIGARNVSLTQNMYVYGTVSNIKTNKTNNNIKRFLYIMDK